MDYTHAEWKGRTGGTTLMQRALVGLLRHTDVRVLYFCMAWVVPFYMLFSHKGYVASYHYFHRRLGHRPVSAFLHVYANHFRFGQVIIDRFAMFAGRHFRFEVEGQELFDQLEQGTEGFVQLSSHVGNYELAGYSLTPRHKCFYALVFGGETATMQRGRSRLFDVGRVTMVPVSEDMSHIFVLSDALGNGHIVSMPGDRIFGSPRAVSCQLLGATARFPLGPFAMAVQREVPLLAVFVLKESAQTYRIVVRRVEADSQLPRRERMEALARSFATHLDAVLRRYPHQWFNYYEFWQ